MSTTVNPAQPYFPQIDQSIDPKVSRHLQNLYTAINQHDLAIIKVNSKASNLQTSAAAASTTEIVSSSSSSSNVNNFTGLGSVNDQESVVSYTLQQSDNGALITISDASAIAISLNSNITSPFFCFLSNLGSSASATLTPTTGTVNGNATFTLLPNSLSVIVFSGGNWWASAVPIVPLNFPAVSGEFLTAYNSSTGAFSAAQPATTLNVNIQTTNYVAISTDQIIQMNAAGATTVTLPTTSITTGRVYYVKNVGAGTCTVAGATGNIDSHASIAITQWQAYQFYWDGSLWRQLSQSLSV